jgi:cell pole-organizing protein PopZ
MIRAGAEMRMAKPNQVPESSMEEILASIRKIISEDEAKSPPPARPVSGSRPVTPPPVNNVSPLFRDELPRAIDDNAKAEPAPTASRPLTDEPDDWISQRPIYSQFGEMRGTSEKGDARKAPERTPSRAISEREARPARPELPPAKALPGGSLLSPRADAAVASAFNQLAGTMLSTSSRTIEQVTEDMLRPMLKDWLDENLPPMVERLVREEIERVSRRR